MLQKRTRDLAEAVWKAAAKLGRDPPAVTDAIIEDLYPVTTKAAIHEGASSMLRNGVMFAVARILRSVKTDPAQGDFADISPQFHPLVRELKSGSYYVEQLGVLMPINVLIKNPPWLDDARKFMHRKGEECHAEGRKLDALYEAVMADAGK